MSEENRLQEADTVSTCVFNRDAMNAFLQEKAEQGVSSAALAKYKTALTRLLEWLQGDQSLTIEKLGLWRREIENQGYSKVTV